MGLAQSLRSVADQFGGGHDDYDDYYDDDVYAAPAEHERGEAPRRGRGGSAGYDDIYRDEPLYHSPPASERAVRPLALVRPPRTVFALVAPAEFDDAQHIADHLRADSLVIVDLQGCEQALTKRLTDFCSGLIYALEGSLQYIGENVVLLVPNRVDLSSEALGGLRESRFFNQM
jgi:cell division inhibitor SepF